MTNSGSSRETAYILLERKRGIDEEREREKRGERRRRRREEITRRHTIARNFLATLPCLEEQNAEGVENWGGS